MDLIVFDLDGTLLNKASEITDFTRETLALLRARDIAFTVATGRTLHAARKPLQGHDFTLPQIYKNGVMIWHPQKESYSHKYMLTHTELHKTLKSFAEQHVTPFIFTLDNDNRHAAYHPPIQSEADERLVNELSVNRHLPLMPISELPEDAQITNISALGQFDAVQHIVDQVETQEHLVAYRGGGMEASNVYWLDIHHSEGSKGAALLQLKADLGASNVLCFGDSDNDLSMFETADEAYAPENSLDEVKAAATSVIGHHDDDGIARFLRERFSL
ncbi:MAG: Cof subfamily protein (haloacid dehalogenase superfamily) [Halioglobus sp.]|jgi:Cof subfamily protein (haloacid dehalogenase superfamily)